MESNRKVQQALKHKVRKRCMEIFEEKKRSISKVLDLVWKLKKAYESCVASDDWKKNVIIPLYMVIRDDRE